MAQEINGVTDRMQKFNPTPPGSVTGATTGTSGGGGMPEGEEFAKAEAAAAQALEKFVNDVRDGFAEYTKTVHASADDYLQADAHGAQAISQAQQPFPMMFQGGR